MFHFHTITHTTVQSHHLIGKKEFTLTHDEVYRFLIDTGLLEVELNRINNRHHEACGYVHQSS